MSNIDRGVFYTSNMMKIRHLVVIYARKMSRCGSDHMHEFHRQDG